MAEVKTNAMRMLDKSKTPYQIFAYDAEDGQIHGTAVAEKIGKPAEQVYKTLVAHQGSSLFVFIIPVAEELDLKKAAKAAGVKKIEMLPLKDLQQHTGYVRGGCSPIGMKKLFPTFIDSRAEGLETILVSAGRIGLQMELTPHQLAAQVKGKFAPLIRESGD
ncbi:Cys-tRNA(Pro) deacylase [Paenibacillus phoenicis]|uniref:Cys-tRNA(Pro)/Cys-tRNA(Cys) deacylase n=1 Tax=Paenibacillus phoenicis TaxID=554117 RepID=A0ABU5PJ66_9BACL|nr:MULTISPECIES: Cys-tRNA(Pro) deacylase [Paenibacillus]EES72176.1 YbaK/EbsC protein [Paenibacillus sp. oral taxon 786 str. D14]MCT2195444.1 Cys-tRNA(Pro) deacylase [Paenibacillus sp. p3-SID1389]MEA3569752.1 Cys-tRNA(Pro) deacylase [Paenibacillus phoenicis]